MGALAIGLWCVVCYGAILPKSKLGYDDSWTLRRPRRGRRLRRPAGHPCQGGHQRQLTGLLGGNFTLPTRRSQWPAFTYSFIVTFVLLKVVDLLVGLLCTERKRSVSTSPSTVSSATSWEWGNLRRLPARSPSSALGRSQSQNPSRSDHHSQPIRQQGRSRKPGLSLTLAAGSGEGISPSDLWIPRISPLPKREVGVKPLPDVINSHVSPLARGVERSGWALTARSYGLHVSLAKGSGEPSLDVCPDPTSLRIPSRPQFPSQPLCRFHYCGPPLSGPAIPIGSPARHPHCGSYDHKPTLGSGNGFRAAEPHPSAVSVPLRSGRSRFFADRSHPR